VIGCRRFLVAPTDGGGTSFRAACLAQARRDLEALRAGKPLVGDFAAPPSAIAGIEQVLEAIAGGGGAAVLPLDAELTTQEAADLLCVSRPTFVKLLEAGAVPFRTIGSHRRIRTMDLLAYLDRERAAQNRALDELVALNQAAGLYD